MHRRFPAALAALVFGLSATALHAQQASALQRQMGAEAFRQAGLEKLSPQELRSLEAWLAAHGDQVVRATPASEVASAGAIAGRASPFQAAAPSRQPASDDAVASRIAGRFDGWTPGSILKLENGQQWRVSDDSSLTVVHALDRPPVTVKPGLLGGWLFKVQGYNASARVEPAN
jgi:hypothetical protein